MDLICNPIIQQYGLMHESISTVSSTYIKSVKKNPYYDVNSQNLANVPTKIQKLGYEVSAYRNGDAIADIDGFYVKERH